MIIEIKDKELLRVDNSKVRDVLPQIKIHRTVYHLYYLCKL